MRKLKLVAYGLLAAALGGFATPAFADWTTGSVPSDGVYKFTFGVSETQDGSFPVPASAVCDVNGSYTDTFSYGFLGTTDDSYKNDVPSNLKAVPHAIDGFKVVKGQKIVLHNGVDADGTAIVYGPAASEYLPAGASSYEGRYPVRFSARMPERGYYAVSCTVANASTTANADVTLFSERCHTHAQHLALEPGETKTFAWSVELAPNYFKGSTGGTYYDNAINVVVVGENAALASVTVTKQPTTTENATIRGAAAESINVGTTMWLCDDSTGTDQRCDTPYFNLQNYAGTGSGLSRWAPPALSIRNQGEGGLASSDKAHLATCLLKPGDYLYVQYGHNENSTAEFTANLEKYLTLATNSNAKLIIASPVERHNTWDSTTETYGRGLKAYADAGEAWVKAKIDAGVTDVAFVDLNKTFVDWQNEEIDRINGINPAISKKAAIEFYYQSSKGGKVDISHPNNAGADWGAYAFWQAALDVVNAGANAEEGSYAKVQAEVLSGIMDGVAARVADDEPWKISDEIINAGAAPNSYWDATVRAGYDYINSAAVAAVDATCEDGVVTLSGVSMRVMNQVNYAKAVIDIVSADKATTNRWYSYYNYDASGSASGDVVIPEADGFLNADLSKDVASTSSAEYSATLTIPAGAKAYVWFAEASGETWQVGDNADSPISAKYPLEAWTSVLLDDDCSDTSTWTDLFGGVNTFAVADGAISFSMTGYDSGTNKKNGGFAKAFADSATIADGRFRVSFKALYTQGEIRFALSQVEGSSSYPMGVSGGASPKSVATLNGSASVLGAAANVTLSDAETPVAQATVNSDEWMDVDMIVDLDAGKATASIGGADYATFPIGTLADGAAYSYFGVTLANEKAHAGAIDDVKIVTLAPSPKYLVEAAANNSAYGHVEINGTEATSLEAVEGSDVALTAVSADDDLYKFVRWTNAAGRSVSTKKTLFIESIAAAASYTAVFEAYGHDDDRVVTWDFSEYAASPVAASAATTVQDDGLSIFLKSGDAIADDGIYWSGTALKKWDGTVGETDRHIEWRASADGTVEIVFSTSAGLYNSDSGPYLCVATNEQAMTYKSTAWASQAVGTTANTDTVLTFKATADTLYKIYSYYQNRDMTVTVKSITYTYAPTWCTVTATAGTGGSATASASEVISGKPVTFTATPVSAAYTFTNWTDGEGSEVSTEATYTTTITADTALTANFALVAAGGTYSNVFDFAPFAANPVSTPNGAANGETAYGPFTIYTSGSSYGADTITGNGIYWHIPANDCQGSDWNGDQPCDYVHYMKLVAPFSGTVKIVFSVDKVVSSRQLNMCVTSGDLSNATYNGALKKVQADSANTDYELSYEVTAGTTYWFYGYSSNWSGAKNPTATTISSIIYAYSAETTTLTLAAREGGAVAINGVEGTGDYTVQKGEYVKLVATPDAYYGLSNWTDGDSNALSTDEEFWCYVDGAMNVTANFADESSIDITRAADFSTFAGDDAITGESAWSQLVGRMEVHGAKGDTLRSDGIYWDGPGTTSSDDTPNTSGRFIKFVCVKSGSVSLTFHSSVGKVNSNYARMYVTDGTSLGEACMYKGKTTNPNHVIGGSDTQVTAANTDRTITFSAEAGKTYYIWPYFYGYSSGTFYITSITYAAVKSDYAAVTIEGADGTSVTNLYYGSSVALDAPAISGNKVFEGWKVGDETVSTATHLFYTATGEATVTASYRDADAHNFVWASDVASGDWNDPYNWLYEGVFAASTYPSDASQDVVVFNTAATVGFPAAAAASNVTFNAAVTMQSDDTNRYGLTAVLVDGTGAVTLANAGFATPQNTVATNNVNIIMAAGTTNWFNTVANKDWGCSFALKGDISGEGCYQLNLAPYRGCGFVVSGNNNGFVGDAYTTGGDSNRSPVSWSGEYSAGINTYWHIGHSYRNDDGLTWADTSSAIAKVGGYDGTWVDRNETATVTIGYMNRESRVTLYNVVSGRKTALTKVGTANLTLGSTSIRDLTINGGSVTMPIGIAPNTLTIAEGTKIIIPGDAAWTAGTVTNLFSYTTLAGTGAETLAEQVEVTGLAEGLAAVVSIDGTTVKATIIAVPYTDDENATIEKDANTGAYTITTDAESLEITVPDGVTVSEVVVSTNTTNVTGVPASAAVKLAVAWVDAESGSQQTASYAIVTIGENGAVTLKENATVTVGEEEISVKPQTDKEADEPIALTTKGLQFPVKTIPGLCYRVISGTTVSGGELDGDIESGEPVQATSTSTTLGGVDLPDSGARYYRISVDVRKE